MAVASLEEHSLYGGLGSLLAELLADVGLGLPLKRFGIPDSQLYAYGERARLHTACGLDSEAVIVALLHWWARRRYSD